MKQRYKEIWVHQYFMRQLWIKQGRYWQMDKHKFLVAWNAILMRCTNTDFMFTSENCSEIEVNFIVCANTGHFYVKYCSVLAQY